MQHSTPPEPSRALREFSGVNSIGFRAVPYIFPDATRMDALSTDCLALVLSSLEVTELLPALCSGKFLREAATHDAAWARAMEDMDPFCKIGPKLITTLAKEHGWARVIAALGRSSGVWAQLHAVPGKTLPPARRSAATELGTKLAPLALGVGAINCQFLNRFNFSPQLVMHTPLPSVSTQPELIAALRECKPGATICIAQSFCMPIYLNLNKSVRLIGATLPPMTPWDLLDFNDDTVVQLPPKVEIRVHQFRIDEFCHFDNLRIYSESEDDDEGVHAGILVEDKAGFELRDCDVIAEAGSAIVLEGSARAHLHSCNLVSEYAGLVAKGTSVFSARDIKIHLCRPGFVVAADLDIESRNTIETEAVNASPSPSWLTKFGEVMYGDADFASRAYPWRALLG